MKLHVVKRGAVAALILAGALVSMAGPAAALPGPIEDLYRDTVEPLPGQILDAIGDACDTADCAGILQEVADLQQGVNEDIEFLTEELPCEQTGNCATVEQRIADAQNDVADAQNDVDDAQNELVERLVNLFATLCSRGVEPFCG